MSPISHRSKIVYEPGLLAYDFGPYHPLRPERITASFELIRAAGLLDGEADLLKPSPAEVDVLRLVHGRAYINAVREAGSGWFPRGELRWYGLSSSDNPPFPGMHEAAALVTGGSVEAARAIMAGEINHAFNPAGGLHHAHRDKASGFCIYNDPAVAAAVAVEEFGARVLYLDFDCHHGDGVQWLFYHDPRVLTVSFHETGRFLFPGTGDPADVGEGPGKGFSINVPVAPFTQDESWIEAVLAIVPEIAERYKPDLIISSHGADTHTWDPLTHLSLTTRAFDEQARLVHRLVHELAGGRWLAVGSGGYDWRRVVPRSWAIVWAEMTGRALPPSIPEDWIELWREGADGPMPDAFMDAPDLGAPGPRAAEVRAENRRTVELTRSLSGLPVKQSETSAGTL